MHNLYKVSIETKISTPVEALFDFHLDTNNLPKITPPNTKVDIIKLPRPMHEGAVVVLDVTKFWIKQHWEVEIVKLQAPNIIVDRAIISPFADFVHEHIFEAVEKNSSLLRDNIYFSLPLAPLSDIIAPLVKRDIRRMFAHRHQETKRILEKR